MTYFYKKWEDLGVTAQYSAFTRNDVEEYHAMLHVEPCGEPFSGQLQRLQAAADRLAGSLEGARPVMKRYFLSDATNQVSLIPADSSCAVSLIQQAPLDGSKVALWLYLVKGADVQSRDGLTLCRHNGYTHLWQTGLSSAEGNSHSQTAHVLHAYEATLQRHDATLLDDCVRTWFFVRDVDTQYAGMVSARRENFEEQGLTPATHYLASTGIQGLPANPHAIIQMDAYAVLGLKPGQQHYLKALSHLNPTIEYGVTFERATVVDYGDRSHCFISGTASIDNKGEVLHKGDIVGQAQRMWENIEVLLHEGQFSVKDIAQAIVYLRDTADYTTVRQMFAERFPSLPVVITLAPVCRPEWLIEMECIAIAERDNAQYEAL